MIEVSGLTKKYGNHLAVDHLTFQVEKGKIYGFLGPNGAGKSTTMNILTGYLAATEGTVLIDGKDIQKEPEEAKKHIGYLPEIPPLYMEMTVLEYLKFAAELKKVPKADRTARIETVMKQTGLTDMQSRLIKNLSKGYRQRVGLAQAIMGNPEVIILDEPSVGLDPKQIIEMRELIKELGKEHTVILSSHILSEVSAVCDHIMIISHGRLVASDTPEGLMKTVEKSKELDLTIRGDRRRVQEILERIPGVREVKMAEETEDGCQILTVFTDENVDVRETVFYACAKENFPILRMNQEEKNLEDIFLELTGEQTTDASEQHTEVSEETAPEEAAELTSKEATADHAEWNEPGMTSGGAEQNQEDENHDSNL